MYRVMLIRMLYQVLCLIYSVLDGLRALSLEETLKPFQCVSDATMIIIL
jgi:hypothetical protein